jgi:hypothetical protein
MTSAWWLLVTFVAGGWCGMLVMALMQLGGDLPEQSDAKLIASDPIWLRTMPFQRKSPANKFEESGT